MNSDAAKWAAARRAVDMVESGQIVGLGTGTTAIKFLELLGEKATKPIVVRLDGNAVEEGRRILAEANHPLVITVETMDEAAAMAAKLAAGVAIDGPLDAVDAEEGN